MADLGLVVGLGNPGVQYEGTRHNCGFMVIDVLAKRWGISLQTEKKFQGLYGEGRGPQGKLRLLKPLTYMNLSGQSVRAALDWFKLDPGAILVIYDDMDIQLGRLRLRASGSAGGHNGIKSLIQHLGTQTFPRIRVGVGQPQGQRDVTGHVLGSFTAVEQKLLPDVLAAAAESIELIYRQDLQTAMNKYNSFQLSPPETEHSN